MQYEDFQRPDISVSFEAEGLVYRRGDQTIQSCEKSTRVLCILYRNVWMVTTWTPSWAIIFSEMILLSTLLPVVISAIEWLTRVYPTITVSIVTVFYANNAKANIQNLIVQSYGCPFNDKI